MRVISGKCRGTHLAAPEGMGTRPTTDRIKETLFNMIAFDIPGCEFLDLFSGSGAISIESLSRGAKSAVLVERGEEALKTIRQNLEKTRLTNEAEVLGMEVNAALTKLKQQNRQFDIIFMDPPYAMENIMEVLEKIENHGLLKPDGYIILERGSNTIVNLPQNLVLWKEKNYRTTILSFIRKA